MNKSINYSMLQEPMRGEMKTYIEHGCQVVGLLRAILCDQVVKSLDLTGDTDLTMLRWWIMFLRNEAPNKCWGSAEKVKAWQAHGGLCGGIEGGAA